MTGSTGSGQHSEPEVGVPLVATQMPTFVRFTGQGGWPADRENALAELTVGTVYGLLRLDVGRSSSTVTISDPWPGGRPRGEYNSVMFDFLAWDEGLDDEPAEEGPTP
jgi:hypothetical protein